MKSINYFIIFFLILTSCQQDKLKKMMIEGNFIFIEKELQHINCILTKENKKDIASILDSITILRLETTDDCLIGEISDIILWKEKIFIGDFFKNKSIFIFDNKGHFIRKINYSGEGENEYRGIHKMGINIADDYIYILDQLSRKILYLDYDGNIFKKESKYKDHIQDVFFQSSGNYLCYMNYTPYDSNNTNYNLLRFSHFDKMINNYFPIGDNEQVVAHQHCFQQFNDEVLFYFPMNENTIYSIKEDTITAKYKINFGNRNMPRDFLQKYSLVKEQIKAKKQSDFFELDAFYETDRFLICSFDEKYSTLYHAIYDKLENQLIWTESIDFEKRIIFDFFIYKVVGNKIISIVDNTSQFFSGDFQINSEGCKKIYNSLGGKEDDNPILLIGWLK